MQMRKLRLRKERPFTQEPKQLKGRAFGGLVCSTKVMSWHHLQGCHDLSGALDTSSVKPEHVTGWLWRVGGRFWMGRHPWMILDKPGPSALRPQSLMRQVKIKNGGRPAGMRLAQAQAQAQVGKALRLMWGLPSAAGRACTGKWATTI